MEEQTPNSAEARPRARVRNWALAIAAAIVVIVLAAGAFTFTLLRAPGALPVGSPPATPGVGVARIFAGASTAPFSVDIGDVRRTPDATGLMVRMTAIFSNRGRTSYRADPGDFNLRDASGAEWPVKFDSTLDCSAWSVTPVQPGSDFGPVPLCFSTSTPPQGPLEVTWDPDVSFVLFSGPPASIPLP